MISECKDTKIPENTHYPNYRKMNDFRKTHLGNQPAALSLSFRITAMLSSAHSIR